MAAVALTKTQVKDLVNASISQMEGMQPISELDLTNVVDLGVKLDNANAYKNFLNNLLVKIGKTIYVDKVYESQGPNISKDSFEYGQLVEKVRVDSFNVTESQMWNLVDGETYDDNVFTKINCSTKVFARGTTFTVKFSITRQQWKDAFTSAEKLGSFISMIFNKVLTEINLAKENLSLLTIKNAIGEVLKTNDPVRAINLIETCEQETGVKYTAATAIYQKEFLRYAAGKILEVSKDMTKPNIVYNESGIENFSPQDKQKFVVISKFVNNIKTYLKADTYNEELLVLPKYEEVNSWQGRGVSNTFADKSTINIKTASGNSVNKQYVIGTIFDETALGISKIDEDVRTKEVMSGKFTNYWYTEDYSYFNDMDEQVVVFYLQDVL